MNNAIIKLTQSVEELKTEIREMRTETGCIKDLKESIEYTQNSLEEAQDKIVSLKSTMDQYQKENLELATQLSQSENRNKATQERLIQLDCYIRRENLKFAGIKEAKNENVIETERKIRDLFVKKLNIEHGYDIEFQRCHRLGPKRDNVQQFPREIIVRFLWFQDRQAIWENKRLLKGSSIVIREDFPEEVENRRSKLYPIFKAAKSQNHKVNLVADKLVLDGRRYTVSSLNTLPAHLQPKELATKMLEKTVLFYGKDSFLSNFYPAPFTIDKKSFTGSEQFFQYEKAVRAGDNETAAKIMNTDDPVQHLRLGKKLTVNNDQWNENVSEAIMETAVTAKFTQNPELLKNLINTGTKLIIDCNAHDIFWGNGLSINDKDASNKSKWKGKNIMGTILCRVRENLK
jgi:ribA/ribD-fused uncharacterized protein